MQLLCRNQTLNLQRPVVMGILNLTPDSFYDGGKLKDDRSVLLQAEKMLRDGASVLDLGGMSSRPGAAVVPPDEELLRVQPALQGLLQAFPECIVSIDTIHASVADACLHTGAHIINDISGGTYDARMLPVVAAHNAAYIIMHMQGIPATMQQQPEYADVVQEVASFFEERLNACAQAGISQIVLDPGFGFGKSVAHNYTLLKNLNRLAAPNTPILCGVSRKSMITKVLHTTPAEALNGTTVLHTLALLQGARILRAHDVKEAMEAILLTEAYTEAGR
jgi:dihydropteroate synthase